MIKKLGGELQKLNTYRYKKEFLHMTNMATDCYTFLVTGKESSQKRKQVQKLMLLHWHWYKIASKTEFSGIWILNASAFWQWILSGYMTIYSRNNPASPLSFLCRHEKERKGLSSLIAQLLTCFKLKFL